MVNRLSVQALGIYQPRKKEEEENTTDARRMRRIRSAQQEGKQRSVRDVTWSHPRSLLLCWLFCCLAAGQTEICHSVAIFPRELPNPLGISMPPPAN